MPNAQIGRNSVIKYAIIGEDSVVNANPLSYYALMQFASNVLDYELAKAEELLASFKADVRFATHPKLLTAEGYIEKERALQPGQQAPDFTMKDPDGKEVKLSDIYPKGKVTMIDFWAGWCNPCRQFNPKLVKIYKEYHKKGFEILGVSLDRDRDQWLDAIKTDKLTWTQVSDINFWDTEAAKLYNVRYIPQNAFVDAEGKIIARRVSEEEIVKLLGVMNLGDSVIALRKIIDERETANALNRAVICETANLDKIYVAASKHLLAIGIIEDSVGLDSLPVALQETARCRMEFQQASYEEMADILGVSKSCLNHRLRKLVEMAENIQNEQ